MTTEIISDIATRSVPSATISSYSFQMQTTGISSAPIKSARQEMPVVGGRDGGAAPRSGAAEASLLNGCSSIELMSWGTIRQVVRSFLSPGVKLSRLEAAASSEARFGTAEA